MKTLDEIINRQDYVRVNEALKARAKELTRIFAKKFYELTGWAWMKTSEYPDFLVNVNGHMYCAKVWRTVGGRIDEVDFVRFYDETYYDEANHRSEYKSHYFSGATHQEFVDFLNDAKDILKQLAEVEDKLVAESEDALENAKNLKTF